MSEYTVQQAVEFALDQDVNSFRAALHDIMTDKVSDAIELKKIQVASSFLNNEEEDQGETNDN
jgi:hypothetical protein